MKYTIKFVKNGEPFEMPDWTTKKHEAAIAECLKNCKDLPAEEQDKELRFYIIYQTLHEIDDTVKLDTIRNLHPEDLIELFEAVYNAGKRGIVFQEKSRTKKKD